MSQSESVQPQKERLPHSGWGIISFWLALLAVAANCLTFVLVEYGGFLNELIPHNWGQGGDPDPLFPTGCLIAFFPALCSFPLSFLALVFGIKGMEQSHTRQVFAIYGVFLSLLPLITWFLVIPMAARAGW